MLLGDALSPGQEIVPCSRQCTKGISPEGRAVRTRQTCSIWKEKFMDGYDVVPEPARSAFWAMGVLDMDTT